MPASKPRRASDAPATLQTGGLVAGGAKRAVRGRSTRSHIRTEGPRGATGDRADTEELLERAALDLLQENGVLAGLNLREVADLAEVNRGLVYLYFGSRQALLRSALAKRAADEPIWNNPRRVEESLPDRVRGDVLELAKADDQVRLHALLHLDGAPDLTGLPYLADALDLLERDRDEGSVPENTDLEALHVLLVSLGAGYALYRGAFAKEVRTTTNKLDKRVADLISDLLRRAAARPPRARAKRA